MSVRNWWDEFPYKRGGRQPVPAGDAGQAGQGTITLFNDTYSAILLELESLRAQVVAMQAVVDAARWVITETRRVEHARCGTSCIWRGLIDSLAALDKAQTAQPEGEGR